MAKPVYYSSGSERVMNITLEGIGASDTVTQSHGVTY